MMADVPQKGSDDMRLPAPFTGGEAPVQPSAYHIGIAINGCAVIEG
jgi:hypothetical protein